MIRDHIVLRKDLTINAFHAIKYSLMNQHKVKKLLHSIDTPDTISIKEREEGLLEISRIRLGASFGSTYKIKPGEYLLVNQSGNIFIEPEAMYKHKYTDLEPVDQTTKVPISLRHFKPNLTYQWISQDELFPTRACKNCILQDYGKTW